MAVVAAVIFSKYSWHYSHQSKYSGKNLQKRKKEFQERANELVSIAYSHDAEKALSLLEKRNKRWGDNSLMQIAYIGYLRNFIASKLSFLVRYLKTYCKHCVHSIL